MNSNVIRRFAVGAALVGLAVGIGIAAAVESRAEGHGVGAYLNDLEDSGITGDSVRLVNVGSGVCDALRRGGGLTLVMQELKAGNYPADEATLITYTAVQDLCPEQFPAITPPPGWTPPPGSPPAPLAPTHESAGVR
jgi:hypothetical protein